MNPAEAGAARSVTIESAAVWNHSSPTTQEEQ